MTTTMLALVIAAPVAAQQPRRGPHGPGGGPGMGPGGPGGWDPGRMEERIDRRADRLAEALDLTAGQKAAFGELRAAQKAANQPKHEQMRQLGQEMRELMQSGSDDAQAIGSKMIAMRQLREELRASREQFEADFAKILTAEQQFALKAMKETRGGERRGPRGDRRERRRGGGPPPPPEG